MPIGRYYKKGQLISEEYFELHETQKDLEDNFNQEQTHTAEGGDQRNNNVNDAIRGQWLDDSRRTPPKAELNLIKG